MSIKSEKPKVCIISPNKSVYSETFIRAHIEQLPARITALYGRVLPETEDGRNLISSPLFFFYRIVRGFPQILGEKRSEAVRQFLDTSALVKFFKRNRVAAVLAEYGPTGVAILPACQQAGIPLVVHFHGCDAFEKSVLEKYDLAYRQMFAVAGAIIYGTKDMQIQLLSLGAPAEKLYCNPCGVDCSRFSATDPGSNPPLFLAVGRFVDKKAPHLTLLAFQRVAEAFPDARLIMVGDGPLWEACQQLAKALKISGQVEFPGILSHSEVAGQFKQARCFVQHSCQPASGDAEGTAITILEAGAAGLPVVSTRHGGIKESVIHGETGFLVAEEEVESMAEHMLMLARDPNLARTMGQRARRHICAHYSMEKSIAGLWGIINNLIS